MKNQKRASGVYLDILLLSHFMHFLVRVATAAWYRRNKIRKKEEPASERAGIGAKRSEGGVMKAWRKAVKRKCARR